MAIVYQKHKKTAGEKMNKLIIFMILGCSTLLSANQYRSYHDRSCSSCDNGNYRDDGYNYGDDGYYRDNGNYREGGYHYRNRHRYDSNNQNIQEQPKDKTSSFHRERNERYYQAMNDQDMRDMRSNNSSSDQDMRDMRDMGDMKDMGDMRSNSSSSDQEISKQLGKTLTSGWFSKGYQDVTYDVNNGNVTLSGSVESDKDKIKAEDAVKKIDGVKSVTNQINVKTN